MDDVGTEREEIEPGALEGAESVFRRTDDRLLHVVGGVQHHGNLRLALELLDQPPEEWIDL
jgi:hypothetical protein